MQRPTFKSSVALLTALVALIAPKVVLADSRSVSSGISPGETMKLVQGMAPAAEAATVGIPAQDREETIVPPPNRENMKITEWEWTDARPDASFSKLNTSMRVSVAPIAPLVVSAPAKVPAEIPYGTFIPKDMDVRGNYNYAAMRIVKGEEVDTLFGLAGSNYSILLTIDETTGVVTIPPQKVYTHNTYGDVYIWSCSVQNGQLVYNESADIVGRMDNSGKITLGGWGLFVASGANKGGWFVAFQRSEWYPANSEVKLSLSDGKTEINHALIEQPYENQITIYNFCGYANPVAATMCSDKSVKITPQLIYTNAMFGPFFNYPAEKSDRGYSINVAGYTEGTGTGNTITTGPWVVASRLAPTSYVSKIVDAAEISSKLTFSYPSKLEGDFSGSGTEADPYLVKSDADLALLAQRTLTDDFKGKYFRLANDIDLSKINRVYQPIGTGELFFNGTFDGNGNTISGLTLDGRGDHFVGLFGAVGEQGTVKNLTVSKFNITSNGQWKAPVVADNMGRISNVTVKDLQLISNGDCCGGITARSTGVVEDCSVSGSLIGVGNVAGIVGYNYGKIYRCQSDATVQRAGHLGDLYRDCAGIAGTSTSTDGYVAAIEDCSFRGTINEASGFGLAGGLVGKVSNSTVKRSFNTGSVGAMREDSELDNFTGGLFAWVSGSQISDCFNAGTVVKSSSQGLPSVSVGGIVGYVRVSYSSVGGGPMVMKDKSKFERCYNSAQIVSSGGEKHKGIWGNTFTYSGMNPIPETFDDCWFDAQIAGFDDGEFGRPTEFFTSASGIANYPASTWKFEQSCYPVLNSLKDTEGSRVASAALLLTAGETSVKVKKNFTLSTPQGVIWKIFDSASSKFVNENSSLKISGNSVSLKDVYANDILVALSSDGLTQRIFRLAIVPKAFDGEGTEQSPYLIKNVDDFRTLNSAVSVYAQSHTGDFFKMTADIDFASAPDFQGVGAGKGTAVAFGGTFDGDNHYIHNLKIKAFKLDSELNPINGTFYTYAGLFNVCNSASVIRNLRIASDCSFETYSAGGTIAGYSEGRIENCRNYADLWGYRQYAGGIVGMTFSSSTVENCYNAGRIGIGYSGAGGMVGYNRGTISYCQNDGEIYGAKYDGQTLSQSMVGGIAGYSNGLLSNCVNNGHTYAASAVGGILGQVSASAGVEKSLEACVNNGIVEATTETSQRGAIAGAAGTYGAISACYYDGGSNIHGAANNGAIPGTMAVATEQLVSGNALEGLSPNDWNFKANAYPVLAKFADEPLAQTLRSIFVKFPQGQSRANVTTTVDLSGVADTKWTLKTNDNFKLSDGKLNVTVPTGMTMAVDTLTATSGSVVKVWALKSIPSIFEGKGTIESPYLIETKADMDKLADFINITGFDYSGFNFRLVNDIDYAGDTIRIVCPSTTRFMASFDGNGKTLKGFVYESTEVKTGVGRYVGPFGVVGSAGHIKNLTTAGTFSGSGYVAGIVGDLYGTVSGCVNRSTVLAKDNGVGGLVARVFDGALVTDCRNEGAVSGTGTCVGGIVATVKKGGRVENSVNNGTVSSTSSGVAGIAGELSGSIRGCRNLKPVVGTASLGGIVANATADAIEIVDCHNEADLVVTNLNSGSTVGGILARSYVNGNTGSSIVLDSCTNSGSMTAKGNVGGIVGSLYSGVTVKNCVNYGVISNTGASNAGGIVGSSSGSGNYPTKLMNCVNHGEIKAHWSYSGGVAGLIASNVEVYDCYNDAPVSMTYLSSAEPALSNVLGIGGFAGGVRGTVVRSWNSGDVTSDYAGMGGFCGVLQGEVGSSEVRDCFNLGNVECKNAIGSNGQAGGLCGYTVSRPTVINFINAGNIKAKDYAGGFVGRLHGTLTMENAYSIGKVEAAGSHTGKLFGEIASNGSLSEIDIYFDSDVCGAASGGDKSYYGATTRELVSSVELGDGFTRSNGAYPMLNGIVVDEPLCYATALALPQRADDSAQNLTGAVWLGNYDKVDWKGSEQFVILSNGLACTEKLGEGTLTATSLADPAKSKTFKFNITALSGIDNVNAEKEVVSRRFVDLNGHVVASPASGNVYILTLRYSDGTETTTKVLVP